MKAKKPIKYSFEILEDNWVRKISVSEAPKKINTLDLDNIYSLCKDIFEDIKTWQWKYTKKVNPKQDKNNQ